MKNSREQSIRQSLMAFGMVLTLLVSTFTAAYFLTTALYEYTDFYPSEWLLQIINLLLAMLFAFLIMGLIVSFMQSRGWSDVDRGLLPLLKAMQQIAKGDFNIKLDNTFGDNKLLGGLVEGVNTMALELGQMERLRQEFISDVSHEIQSPLTSIHGFAQALQNEQLAPEERAQYLDIIMSESNRLGRITENLLRLAALQSEQARFEPRPYRLDKQIRDLILASEPQWLGKGIDMDAALAPVTISADADLLSQVWINLLSNSIKFTPEGGRVCVELQQHDGSAVFRINDTGIGIAAEDQPRLFERFYKADRSRTQQTGGSGLGLSIAKKIVDMHKGSIEVRSVAGAGATFTVVLPDTKRALHSTANSARQSA